MTVSNVGLASVLSDSFGKTAAEIMPYLLEHTAESIDETAVRELIKKGAKAKSNEIIAAIKGYKIESDQARKLDFARNHLDYLADMITQTEAELYVRIKPYYNFVELVSSMPGMTQLSSTIMLAETGVDMSVFDDAKHMASWVGLVPRSNESTGKKHSVARRRGKKKAIIAIARMMVICIYHMINDQKPFSPCDYEELMDPQAHPVRVELNDVSVFEYLQSQGYNTSVLVKCNGN